MFSVLLCTLSFVGPPTVESICPQMAPAKDKWMRTAERTQAVLLIHGFHYHLFDKDVPKAGLRPWQKADSPLVKELGKSADVFAFAYGQNVSLETVIKESKLAASIAELRKLGYKEIVLVGHSAGGLIARQFVEDNPDAGVTKVIQVCASQWRVAAGGPGRLEGGETVCRMLDGGIPQKVPGGAREETHSRNGAIRVRDCPHRQDHEHRRRRPVRLPVDRRPPQARHPGHQRCGGPSRCRCATPSLP